MPVLDWIRSLAGTPASPSSRVIVAPPDVNGTGSGGGGSAGARAAAEKEEPEDPERQEPQTQEDEDEAGDRGDVKNETDAGAGGSDGEDEDDDDNTSAEEAKDTTMTTAAPSSSKTPTQTPEAEKAATIAELKAAFPGETDFIMDCAEKQLTIRDAKGAFADVLLERNKKLGEQLKSKDNTIKGLGDEGRTGSAVAMAPAGARAPVAAGPRNEPGKPMVVNPEHVKARGDTFETYEQVVQAYQDRGLTRAQAFRQAAIDHKDLHDAWRARNGESYTKVRAEARARRR